MTDGQMIIMREREEKSTGTSRKTAFSAMFQVSAHLDGPSPRQLPGGQDE